MNDYTFKDSKYFDVFARSRKTGKITTFRMCQNLNIAYNNLFGTYVFQFLCNKYWCGCDTKDYVITID